MEFQASTQIQLCGQFAVELHGRRLEQRLPSRQGRLLFAYLALHRARAIPRDELIDALWSQAAPANAADALTVLLSKLRGALGADAIIGRASLKLALPADAKIDVEEALAAVHRAESAAALGDWGRAWSAALCAQFIAQRPLLSEHDLPWLEDWRRRLDDVLQRSLEAYGDACLGIGGCELAGAERTGRRLIALNPLRESGYRLVMQSLAQRGNLAEALRVYEQARAVLREELGIAPGPATRELHAELLQASSSPA
ncbi:MAG: winged helix-turn-helix domain-containing protein [Solirubrobacterales bacterium]|nr:winged helix-turn-helix domain-containing protein [Solirubrobacterales bacterium]MBV9716495.1 winged helix-turn-helix domain-containing protein [Solirubrobacterales bacterium]